jgi:Uma2 family endonuclease
LALLLGAHVKANRLGVVLNSDTGFTIDRDPDTVRAPDVSFVRQQRIGPGGIPIGYWSLAPDVVVEVISPSDTLADVEDKVHDWLAAGTSLVWVINPRRRTVTVYRSPNAATILTEGDRLDGQDVVPGFSCSISELFP